MSGWRDRNPHDPLDRRMRATTQLRAVGLEPRPGESTEARYRRYANMFAHLFNDGPLPEPIVRRTMLNGHRFGH